MCCRPAAQLWWLRRAACSALALVGRHPPGLEKTLTHGEIIFAPTVPGIMSSDSRHWPVPWRRLSYRPGRSMRPNPRQRSGCRHSGHAWTTLAIATGGTEFTAVLETGRCALSFANALTGGVVKVLVHRAPKRGDAHALASVGVIAHVLAALNGLTYLTFALHTLSLRSADREGRLA